MLGLPPGDFGGILGVCVGLAITYVLQKLYVREANRQAQPE
jgi:uncharacterized membrane protein (DUF485 family)